MDRDQFFGELFNEQGANADAIRAQQQLSFEERVIKRVFTECGAKQTSWGRLVNECRNATGQQNLIFKNPGKVKNRLAAAVANNLHKQEVDSDRPFVFLFPVTRTMFCAHNIDTETGEYPRIQWRATFRPMNNLVLLVEPTISLFQTIGADWVE